MRIGTLQSSAQPRLPVGHTDASRALISQRSNAWRKTAVIQLFTLSSCKKLAESPSPSSESSGMDLGNCV